MPWHIARRGDQFCVVLDAGDEVVKCHPTREAALAHMRALYASEGKALEQEGGLDRHELMARVAEHLGVEIPMYQAVAAYLWKQREAPRVELLGGNEAKDVVTVLYAGANGQGKLYGVENLVAQELVPDRVERDVLHVRAVALVAQVQ